MPTLLLAGDPRQLGPVLKNPVSLAAGGAISLIEQVVGVSALPAPLASRQRLSSIIHASASIGGVKTDDLLQEMFATTDSVAQAAWNSAAVFAGELHAPSVDADDRYGGMRHVV